MAEKLHQGGKAAIGVIVALLIATWAHAADVPVPGKVAVVRAGSLARFISSNRGIAPSTFPLSTRGSAEDPTVSGAELQFFDTALFGAGVLTFGLDRSGWKGLGNPPGSTGYRYKGKDDVTDPDPRGTCKKVLLREKLIRATCRGASVTLTTPFSSTEGIIIGIPAGTPSLRYCAEFGGLEKRNDAKMMKRKDASVPAVCPEVPVPISPECGDGAVNQPGEQCDPPDESTCPGQCLPDCTCPPPPECGDGVVNRPSEQCDPPDESACPGECLPVCACPMPPDSGALLCQRAIEQGGMLYAEQMLQAVESCAAPGEPASIQSCLASQPVQDQLEAVRTQWAAAAAERCASVNVHSELGYLATCGAAPSGCTFPSAVLDAPGESNDLLDCLACRIAEDLGETGRLLFADQPASGSCHSTLGQGGIGLLRTLLEQVDDCLAQPGATSIAACFQPDEVAWRAQAVSECAGVDPFTAIGYPNLCSGVEPVFPGRCATHGFPCTFRSASDLSTPGVDDDLLDCLSCRLEEAVLGVARQLHGANLCCIGGACDVVLSRFACRQANGTPVHYQVDTLWSSERVYSVHGFDVRPDGTLYLGDHSGVMKKVSPTGEVSVIGSAPGFITGVAVDDAGNIYYTLRCAHQVMKMSPSGQVTVFAGTGVAGHWGDGGPATGAQIVAPDGITLDAAGNVYFTESGFLDIACGGGIPAAEHLRMVDTAGNIQTVAGGAYGTAGIGGPASEAQLALPYSLWRAFDGTLLLGENGAMRVLRIDAGGILAHVAGRRVRDFVGAHSGYGGPALQARFYHTCGLGGDADGNVVVGAMEDNRIALVDRLGSVIGIAGTGERSSSEDPSGDGGPAVLARGLCCEEVEASADSRVFCSDLWTNRIRVLTREAF